MNAEQEGSIVGVTEAKRRFLELVERVEEGERIVINQVGASNCSPSTGPPVRRIIL